MGFPHGSDCKESDCNVGDLGSIPGLGRSPGEGNCYSLQYPGQENSMDNIVHGVTTLVAQMVRRLPTMRETQVWSLGREDPWRRKWQPTPVFLPGKSHGLRFATFCTFTGALGPPTLIHVCIPGSFHYMHISKYFSSLLYENSLCVIRLIKEWNLSS